MTFRNGRSRDATASADPWATVTGIIAVVSLPVRPSIQRVLVVEHESDSGAAMLGQRAEQLGFTVDVVTPNTGIPRSAAGYVMVMPMGAAPSVNDDHIQPWLVDETALLKDADERGVPIFGVCFGAQALAVALGGSVTRASKPEIGWFTVDTDDPTFIPPGPWFEWHVDAITPPPGATVLASTDVCIQAYTIGRHLAVQFHPEVTDNEISQWSEGGGQTLHELGIDASAMLQQTRELLPAARGRANELFDAFLVHARLTAPETTDLPPVGR